MPPTEAAEETVGEAEEPSDTQEDVEDAIAGEAACSKPAGGKGKAPWASIMASSRAKLALLLLMVQLKEEAKGMPEPEVVNTRAAECLGKLKKELEDEKKSKDRDTPH